MITRRELRRQREEAERAASSASAPVDGSTAVADPAPPSAAPLSAAPTDSAPTSASDAFADLRARHLLLLDEEIEVSDVLALVHNRLPDVAPRLGSGDQVRLSRHSRLHAGVDLDPAAVAALEIPDWTRRAVVLETPRDREPAPPPDWFEDADGLHEAFPKGLPDREEERALSLLIAIASRLHLAVRLADEVGMGTRVLVPDPEAKVDLYLYSPYWLEPEVALSLVRRHAPHAFQQELPTPDTAVLAQASLDDPLFDATAPVILDGYSLLIPLGELDEAAGGIEIRVTEAEWVPPIVRAAAELPQIEYHVHWMDTEEIRFRPGHDRRFRRMRAQVASLVDAIGAELLARSDGIGLDENGFLVTTSQLRS